jgi:hypothetical protein
MGLVFTRASNVVLSNILSFMFEGREHPEVPVGNKFFVSTFIICSKVLGSIKFQIARKISSVRIFPECRKCLGINEIF